jgi:hypothetical protein
VLGVRTCTTGTDRERNRNSKQTQIPIISAGGSRAISTRGSICSAQIKKGFKAERIFSLWLTVDYLFPRSEQTLVTKSSFPAEKIMFGNIF